MAGLLVRAQGHLPEGAEGFSSSVHSAPSPCALRLGYIPPSPALQRGSSL